MDGWTESLVFICRQSIWVSGSLGGAIYGGLGSQKKCRTGSHR